MKNKSNKFRLNTDRLHYFLKQEGYVKLSDLLESLPKEKEIKPYTRLTENIYERFIRENNEGYNQCLKDIRERFNNGLDK